MKQFLRFLDFLGGMAMLLAGLLVLAVLAVELLDGGGKINMPATDAGTLSIDTIAFFVVLAFGSITGGLSRGRRDSDA